MTDLENRLAEEDVQKVLARALELEAQSAQGLTVAQIRALAADLAIPESAVDQALSEYREAAAARLVSPSATTAAPTLWERRGVTRVVMLSIGIGGGALVLLVLVSMMLRLFP